MKINRILILVELDGGHVHQVLADPEKKEICMGLLQTEDGRLLLSERVEPITLEIYSEANA
jgi:hypothetical protein